MEAPSSRAQPIRFDERGGPVWVNVASRGYGTSYSPRRRSVLAQSGAVSHSNDLSYSPRRIVAYDPSNLFCRFRLGRSSPPSPSRQPLLGGDHPVSREAT
jgi:hypothetical protein